MANTPGGFKTKSADSVGKHRSADYAARQKRRKKKAKKYRSNRRPFMEEFGEKY